MAEGDVADVEEHFVLALPVPHLTAGVTRVGHDGADGALGPGDAAAVPVPGRVVRGRARDAVGRQVLGDRVQAVPGQELGEDPLHDRCGRIVDREGVQPPAVRGLGRIRVRPCVDQPVPVRRTTTQIPAFQLGLSGHRRSDPDPDPVPLALRDATEHGHDQVVGLVVGVDRPADLWHPQRHAVVGEQREGVAELVAVERPLRLPNDDRVEPASRVGERGDEPTGFRAALRRDGAGLVDVEELGDDLPAVRLDQAAGAGELPPAG